MKQNGQRISIRHSDGVNFLRVPDGNVVDLRRSHLDEPPPVRRARRLPISRGSAARKAVAFFVIALAVVLPIVGITLWQRADEIKGDVLGASTEGVDALRAAGDAMAKVDAELASREFAAAAASFREARSTLDSFRFALNGLADAVPFVASVKAGDALLAAGEEVAKAGESVVKITAPLLAAGPDRTVDFTGMLYLAREHLPAALEHVNAAVDQLETVRAKDLPENLREPFAKVETALPQIKTGLAKVENSADVLFDLVGGTGAKRYLVLFQNNLELRPTGGFISAFALVDVADGRVTKLQVPSGGAYDLKGQLTEKVIAPEPLHIVNPHWQLQDANWWPDFPTSARKILWFYEKSGGPTVDGVIALTPDVIVDILAATGPIDLTAEYGLTISAENVVGEMLASETYTPDKPKQLIADLVPRVLDRVLNTSSADQITVLGILEHSIAQKQLLLSFTEDGMQKTATELGWSGALTVPERDGLLVVDTNIGGGKTDGVVDEKIDHAAVIADDGSIVDTVTITRTHHGVPNDEMTGVRNVDFVRIYVPNGSELMSANGFERIDPKRFMVPEADYRADPDIETIEGRPVVDELSQTRVSAELGFTVFGNWIGVGPGETSTATITYRLPFRLDIGKRWFGGGSDEYSLLIQKQPGTNGRFLTTSITYPEKLALSWVTPQPDGLVVESGSVRFAKPLDTDRLLGFILSAE